MPTATYIPLATLTLTGTPSAITFGSIPSTYRDLVLVMSGTASTATDISVQINSDSGSNYSSVRMIGDGVNTSSSTNSGTSGQWLRFSSSPTTGSNILQFMDYSATDKHKTILIRYDNSNSLTAARAARWASTNAINTIKITTDSGTYNAGTTFSLYGIAG